MYHMAMQVKITSDKQANFTIVPHGSIDSDTYMEFQEKVKPLLDNITKNIVLDLAHVDYISSAGLGVLFTMKKHLKQHGGDLLFCNVKPQIKRLFEIVNALPKETLFKDVEEADAYLYKMMNREIEKNREK